MEIENQDRNEIDLNELLSTINVSKLKKPFDDYLDTLKSFYSEYEVDTNTYLLRHFKTFNPDNLSSDDSKFVEESLRIANFDVNSLRHEQVILFSEPVLVSELYCSRVPLDENTNSVRLISYLSFEKKVVTRKHKYRNNKLNTEVTAYQIHDNVLGLIIPKNALFQSVGLVTYEKLLKDQNKLEIAQKALQQAQELPTNEMQNIINKFSNINLMIRSNAEKIDSIKANIKLLEQEKLHSEHVLDNTKKALNKTQMDLEKATSTYAQLTKELSDKEDILGTINERIEQSLKLQERESTALDMLATEAAQTSSNLKSLKTELADALREKNLTTLDIIGHSRETSRQLFAYYFFSFLTFSGLTCMAIYVYKNGKSFSEILPYLVHVNAWDILLSRLPLVAATTLIIGGLSGVFFYLIRQIVSLNTEKMTMLKAGILAEQITNSLDCKNMSEDQILEFKRDTKIKLIMEVFSKQYSDKHASNLIIEAIKAMNSK